MKSNKKKTSIKAKSPVHISRNGKVNEKEEQEEYSYYQRHHYQQHSTTNTNTNMNRERMDTDQTSNVSSSHTTHSGVSSMAYQFAVQEYRNTIPSQPNEEQQFNYNHSNTNSNSNSNTASYQQNQEPVIGIHPSSSTIDDYESDDASHDFIKATSTSYSFPNYPGSPSQYLHQRKAALAHTHTHSHPSSSNYIIQEPEMVDATYKEHYGDSYINAPLRYIYPQGYGSMRPRSRPWQISLIMVTTLAWLNVFIVGHCADQYNTKYQENYNANIGDDDLAVQIETRWCGSKSLYFIWVLSVAVTAMSFAYCSCIGYVKARDFAVANGRSQPPGMVGKSDYYVELGFGTSGQGGGYDKHDKNENYKKDEESDNDMDDLMYGGKNSIYQADGTPKYYGNQITKPTQAAVNMTSR